LTFLSMKSIPFAFERKRERERERKEKKRKEKKRKTLIKSPLVALVSILLTSALICFT